MARKHPIPTVEDISRSEGDLRIISSAEAKAEADKIKALISQANDVERLRLFYEGTEAAITSNTTQYAPYITREEFIDYSYRAGAAVLIGEDYDTLRRIFDKVGIYTLSVRDLTREYQSAALFIGALDTVSKALHTIKAENDIDIPEGVKEALRKNFSNYASGYGAFVRDQRNEKGVITGFSIDLSLVLDRIRGEVGLYRRITREAKTIISAIQDTTNLLDISTIVPRYITSIIEDTIKTIEELETALITLINGLEYFAERIKAVTPTIEQKAIIEEYRAAIIPYNRTHAYTEEYKKYVAGYYQATPGDNGVGDKILKEIARYKRNNKKY